MFPEVATINIPKEFDIVAAENDIFMNKKYNNSPERKRFLSRYFTKFNELGIEIGKNETSYNDICKYFAEDKTKISLISIFTRVNFPKLVFYLFKNDCVDEKYVLESISKATEVENQKSLLLFLEYFTDFIPEVSNFTEKLGIFKEEYDRFMSLSKDERIFLRDNDVFPNSLRFFIKNDDVEKAKTMKWEDDAPYFSAFEQKKKSPLALAAFYGSKKCIQHYLNCSSMIIDKDSMYEAVKTGDLSIIKMFEESGGKPEKFIKAAVESHNVKVMDYCISKFAAKKNKNEIINELKSCLIGNRNAQFLVYCIEVGVSLNGLTFYTEFIPFVSSKTKLSFKNVEGNIHFGALKALIDSGSDINECDDILARCTQVDSVFLLLEKGVKSTDRFIKTVLPLFDPSECQWVRFKLAYM